MRTATLIRSANVHEVTALSNRSSITMSTQDSVEQPPLKKQKIAAQPQSSQDDIFKLSQPFMTASSKNSSQPTKVVIKKGDKIERRVDQLLRGLTEKAETSLVMASGDAIQKLVSIVEIVKLRLGEQKEKKFEQFNNVDMFETIVKRSEVLDKKVKTPVFYCLLREVSKEGIDDELKLWTRQVI